MCEIVPIVMKICTFIRRTGKKQGEPEFAFWGCRGEEIPGSKLRSGCVARAATGNGAHQAETGEQEGV
ncbi:MAG TPA: hypothetical protein PKN34_06950, partial [Azospira sp.]|nr:hypothetical protein [Azospira sp.]